MNLCLPRALKSYASDWRAWRFYRTSTFRAATRRARGRALMSCQTSRLQRCLTKRVWHGSLPPRSPARWRVHCVTGDCEGSCRSSQTDNSAEIGAARLYARCLHAALRQLPGTVSRFRQQGQLNVEYEDATRTHIRSFLVLPPSCSECAWQKCIEAS